MIHRTCCHQNDRSNYKIYKQNYKEDEWTSQIDVATEQLSCLALKAMNKDTGGPQPDWEEEFDASIKNFGECPMTVLHKEDCGWYFSPALIQASTEVPLKIQEEIDFEERLREKGMIPQFIPDMENPKRARAAAVVVDTTGIASGVVALKRLNIAMKKVSRNLL